MSIESVQNKDMLAYKGNCCVGMTLQEAKESGGSVFCEFKKINTDGDEIISFNEIVAQRNKCSTKKRRWGNLFLGIGAYYCYNGIKIERQPKKLQEFGAELASRLYKTNLTPQKIKRMNLWNVAFFVGIGLIKYIKSKNIDKETQEYTKSYYKQIST